MLSLANLKRAHDPRAENDWDDDILNQRLRLKLPDPSQRETLAQAQL